MASPQNTLSEWEDKLWQQRGVKEGRRARSNLDRQAASSVGEFVQDAETSKSGH